MIIEWNGYTEIDWGGARSRLTLRDGRTFIGTPGYLGLGEFRFVVEGTLHDGGSERLRDQPMSCEVLKR